MYPTAVTQKDHVAQIFTANLNGLEFSTKEKQEVLSSVAGKLSSKEISKCCR